MDYDYVEIGICLEAIEVRVPATFTSCALKFIFYQIYWIELDSAAAAVIGGAICLEGREPSQRVREQSHTIFFRAPITASGGRQ